MDYKPKKPGTRKGQIKIRKKHPSIKTYKPLSGTKHIGRVSEEAIPHKKKYKIVDGKRVYIEKG